jgi:glucan-binding YG repeat protein
VPQDPKSKITVNGQEFSDSPIIVNIKGAQKTTVNIEVKSEDGTTSKTYTLEINRVDVADWNPTPNNGEDPNENDQFYDEYSQCWVDTTKYDEWGTVNGKPTYFDKKSRQVKDAWITTGGKLYYLNNLGYRASGWKVDTAGGKTYYLDPTTGEMKKQWMNLDNKWYYLGLNGVMQKGWLNLNSKWYYFSPNGQMVVSQTMYIDDEVCRFGQDGAKY